MEMINRKLQKRAEGKEELQLSAPATGKIK